jgi:predicted MFS family arabinose efflux permease
MQFCLFGATMGLTGYLSLYLKNNGWTTAGADSVFTIMTGAGLIGVIPMVYLADRFKNRKGILFLSFLAMITTLAIIPFIDGNAMYLLLSVGPFLWAGGPPLFNALILDTEGVGTAYGGTAMGLSSACGMFGAFISPL